MTVVSDTTCITTLLKAGHVELLQKLFGTVVVPEAVSRELVAFHGRMPGFIAVRSVPQSAARMAGAEHLGAGESEALALARHLDAELMITDDRQARTAARRLGLNFSGLAGLAVAAKRRGIIPSVTDFLESLQRDGGLYLSDAVNAEARKLAGE